jgi:MYXO-CTERM domain-containing protein
MSRKSIAAWVIRCALAATCLCAGGRAAWAGNGIKPRTPVAWEDVPCMVVVDRTGGAMQHIPYAVPYDDPEPGEELGPDEVADSRTHQFFAFAWEPDLWSYMPRWITNADVAAYAAVDPMFDPMDIDPADVLETSTVWEGAWYRINADDDRRPISHEQAAMGVDWDTSMLPVGTYHLQGYTWEPALNIWSRRPGVYKITDGGDASEYGPAAALDLVQVILYLDQSQLLTGCLDAMDGTTVTAAWAFSDPDLGTDWHVFADSLEVSTGPFEVELAAPAEAAGQQIMVRIVATDPMDRSYTSYLGALATILESQDPGACPDAGTFIGGPGCEDSGDDAGSGATTAPVTSGAVDTSATGDGSTTMPATGDDTGEPRKGCGCTGGERSGAALVLLPMLYAASRRRRR